MCLMTVVERLPWPLPWTLDTCIALSLPDPYSNAFEEFQVKLLKAELQIFPTQILDKEKWQIRLST